MLSLPNNSLADTGWWLSCHFGTCQNSIYSRSCDSKTSWYLSYSTGLMFICFLQLSFLYFATWFLTSYITGRWSHYKVISLADQMVHFEARLAVVIDKSIVVYLFFCRDVFSDFFGVIRHASKLSYIKTSSTVWDTRITLNIIVCI